MIRILALVCLLTLTWTGAVHAQGTITDDEASFVRGPSAWDGSPDGNFTGVSPTLTQDHLYETGWAFRVMGNVQETFFPAPDTQNYNSPQSVHTWNSLAGALFSAVETSVVTDLDGTLGPTPSGSVTMTMTITNLSPIDSLTLDLFHMADFDAPPSAGDDSALLLAGPSSPVIRINDAASNFAVYTGDDADAYLVRPFGATDIGAVLGNAMVDEFGNTGLPFGPGDFTGGVQWNDRVIPPSGSASFTVRFAVNDVLLNADLSVAIADTPDPAVQGGEIQYTVTVLNAGPDQAPNVTASTLLPVGLTIVDTVGCSEDPAGLPDCSLGDIAAGDSAQFVVTATANMGAPSLVTLNVSVASLDINEVTMGDNTDSEETTIAPPDADLSVALLDAPDPVIAGQPLTYTVNVSNAGPSDTNVVATFTLPPELTLLATNGCVEDASGVPTCTLGLLAAGADDSYTVQATVSPGTTGTVDASVSVAGGITDSDPGNNTALANTLVLAPNAELSVTLGDAPDPVLAGQTLTYTVNVANAGPLDATATVATLTLPPELSVVATNGCAEDAAGVPTCTLGTIASGGSAQYTVETLVAPTASGSIDAGVSVDAIEPDSNASDSTAVASTVVTALLPDLNVVKSNDVGGVAVVDASWSWTLLVTNDGNAGAVFAIDDAVLLDQLPDTGIGYGATSVANGGGTTGTATCNVTGFDLECVAASAITLPPGGTLSVSLTALPEDIATYDNPRASGDCSVDPGDAVEESDEADNDCADSVESIDFLIFADGFDD